MLPSPKVPRVPSPPVAGVLRGSGGDRTGPHPAVRQGPLAAVRLDLVLAAALAAALAAVLPAGGCGGGGTEVGDGDDRPDGAFQTDTKGDAMPAPAGRDDAGPARDAAVVRRTPTRDSIGTRRFSRTRYAGHLAEVVGERPPGSERWRSVQDHCATTLRDLGYDVERVDYGSGVNVFGSQAGLTAPDELVLVGAHYDHIPGCSGADDNATGVAGALEVARLLQGVAHDRTLVIACWDEEELGLKGSAAHAMALAEAGVTVELAVSLEMIGYATNAPNTQQIPTGFELAFPDAVDAVRANDLRGDFITLIGNGGSAPAMAAFDTSAGELSLPTVVLEADATLGPILLSLLRSDHASYWVGGWPALMVTDTANFRNPFYHCQNGDDTIESLNLGFAGQVVDATAAAIEATLQR